MGPLNRRDFLAAAAATGLLPVRWARAQGTSDDLRVMSEGAPNSFDSFSPGVNRHALQITWNVYDRLVAFAMTGTGEGVPTSDYHDICPELAERYEVSPDGRTITFALRRGATFHDGAPVTAYDVKFSLDRVLASPIGRAQFATGSMTDPAQFVVADDHTLRIDLPQADRFTLPNLALTYPIIVNSARALAHATAQDPFAFEWLRANPAGGGAFRVTDAALGERILFQRFDAWKSGPRPGFARVLWQVVPSLDTRLAALARGEADVVQDLSPRRAVALTSDPAVRVVGAPTAAFQFIAMNARMPPFDRIAVRQAIAAALPYEAMFQTALYGRGQPLFGGAGTAEGTVFPQPMGTATDPDRARALMTSAGLSGGFDTTFSFDLSQGDVAEPVAVLVQEALARIKIRVTIDKVPSGQIGTALQAKRLGFFFESSIAFLRDSDYFFRIFCSGDTRWNFGSYANPEFDALVAATRHETDPAAYAGAVTRMIDLVKRDLPLILLWHPTLDVALRRDVAGYGVVFHRMLDLRPLSRA